MFSFLALLLAQAIPPIPPVVASVTKVSLLLGWLGPKLIVAAAWLEANPSIDAGLALWVAVSLLNKLQSNPATAQSGIAAFLRRFVDVISGLPHQDAETFIGGLLSRYVQPGVAQALLKLLFAWIPFGPSSPKPSASPTVAQANVSGSIGGSPAASGFTVLRLLPVLAVLALIASASACAFLQKAKAGELDCVKLLESDEGAAVGPEVTLILSTGGADWAQVLGQQEQIVGKDLIWCSVQNTLEVLNGTVPGAPLPDGGTVAPILPNTNAPPAQMMRALVSSVDASNAKDTTISRAQAYLRSKGKSN